MIRHLVSGGYVLQDTNGGPLPILWQAGPKILALLEDYEFVQFMSMKGLIGSPTSVYTPLCESRPCLWEGTVSSSSGIRSLLPSQAVLIRCRSLVLDNHNQVNVGNYLIYSQMGTLGVRRIDEILVDIDRDSMLGVLVSKCTIGADVLPYHLPSCTVRQEKVLFAFEELCCGINVIYNCAVHCCKPEPTRCVMQERQSTDQFEDKVNHINPDGHIWNLAHLRSASYVQRFRSGNRFPDLSLDEVIETAIQNKSRLERETKELREAKVAEKLQKDAEKKRKAEGKQKAKDERERKKAVGGQEGTARSKQGHAETMSVVEPPVTRRRNPSNQNSGGADGCDEDFLYSDMS
ncbi:hypothetical protein B0H10DRAFT_2190741 [Mycena sp. CBHHK59/15]|nr:hypothetical protein B0H10DRAFT_2190741 [Mycena sp. CBHHK59/15]